MIHPVMQKGTAKKGKELTKTNPTSPVSPVLQISKYVSANEHRAPPKIPIAAAVRQERKKFSALVFTVGSTSLIIQTEFAVLSPPLLDSLTSWRCRVLINQTIDALC